MSNDVRMSRTELIVGLVILVLFALLAFVATRTPHWSAGMMPVATSTVQTSPMTPEIQAMLAQSKGVAVLISYTSRGFEPQSASIEKGEAVRFTNNSTHDVWIAAEGTSEHPIYPEAGTCGQSALDTCHVLHPMEFWEFTFNTAGTWQYVNNLNKEERGMVTVHAL